MSGMWLVVMAAFIAHCHAGNVNISTYFMTAIPTLTNYSLPESEQTCLKMLPKVEYATNITEVAADNFTLTVTTEAGTPAYPPFTSFPLFPSCMLLHCAVD